MSKAEQQHTCKENWYTDAVIRYQKINQEEWGWVLEQWQPATDDDIKNGYQGEIGAPMCMHHLLITHCPFCGTNLVEIEVNTW